MPRSQRLPLSRRDVEALRPHYEAIRKVMLEAHPSGAWWKLDTAAEALNQFAGEVSGRLYDEPAPAAEA